MGGLPWGFHGDSKALPGRFQASGSASGGVPRCFRVASAGLPRWFHTAFHGLPPHLHQCCTQVEPSRDYLWGFPRASFHCAFPYVVEEDIGSAPYVLRHRILAPTFKLKSRAFMLTYNSEGFSLQSWEGFRDFVAGLARRLGARAWAACLEKSLRSAAPDLYHCHAYLLWTDGVGIHGAGIWTLSCMSKFVPESTFVWRAWLGRANQGSGHIWFLPHSGWPTEAILSSSDSRFNAPSCRPGGLPV